MSTQLEGYGIDINNIVVWSKDYDYYSHLDPKYYRDELSEQYRLVFGREMNWETPKTYNEIINWEKLNLHDSRRTNLADKVRVKEYIKEKIGEEYLNNLIGQGIYDDVDQINFDNLPNAFVIKMNNGSGKNIIIKDKSKANIDEIRRTLRDWSKINYAYCNGTYEMHYHDIVPKIICEEYLQGVAEDVCDYDVYCFHGEPKYIHCVRGCHTDSWRGAFYDTEWKRQPFSHGCPEDNEPADRPPQLEKMLELSRKLSEGFDHVRIDWWDLPDGRLLFCEMTFSSWAGFSPFKPDKYDLFFGMLITNPQKVV